MHVGVSNLEVASSWRPGVEGEVVQYRQGSPESGMSRQSMCVDEYNLEVSITHSIP